MPLHLADFWEESRCRSQMQPQQKPDTQKTLERQEENKLNLKQESQLLVSAGSLEGMHVVDMSPARSRTPSLRPRGNGEVFPLG